MILLAGLLTGCTETPEPTIEPLFEPITIEEPLVTPRSVLAQHLTTLGSRVPDEGYQQSRQWLIDHPDETHPHLAWRLLHQPSSAARAADVLGRIGQARSVPVLAQALHTTSLSTVRWAAGEALARHPAAEARQVQYAAVRQGAPDAAEAVLMGLQSPGNPEACRIAAAAEGRDDFDAGHHIAGVKERCGCP